MVLQTLLTQTPAKIPITANTEQQLKDVVFPTIRFWMRQLPPVLQDRLGYNSERVWIKDLEESNFAVARTASKDRPEALAGFHGGVLFILEEASGIPEEVVINALGAMSEPDARILMVGNPTRGAGYFFDAFHKLRESFATLHVSSEDVPRARGHIDDIIARYGKDSNQYRVRVLGEFPLEGDDILIPLHLVEAAIDRAVSAVETYRIVWGVDPARYGDDRTAFAQRQGNVLIAPVEAWSNKDTMQTAGILKDKYDALDPIDRPHEILVDAIGIGAGVVDRLRELGLPVRGINVAERPSARPRYRRLRDELWWRAREWFEGRDCKIPDDAGLISELTNVTYEVGSDGKVIVEPKEKMKERVLRSPDLADAFVLTFAGGMSKIEEHQRDKYARRTQRRRSAWSA